MKRNTQLKQLTEKVALHIAWRKYSNIKPLGISPLIASFAFCLGIQLIVILTSTGFSLLIQRMVLLKLQNLWIERKPHGSTYPFLQQKSVSILLRALILLYQVLFLQTLYILESDRQLSQNKFFSVKCIFQSLKFIFGHLIQEDI